MTAGQHAAHRAAALRVLLQDAIDYAGLFPPAQLDMAGAVAEYASYLESADAWALGSFVVPATRLDELAMTASTESTERAGHVTLGDRRRWRLSAVFGGDIAADADGVRAFNAGYGTARARWWGRVEGVEVRASTSRAIEEAIRLIPVDCDRFVEVPIAEDPAPLVRAIARGNAFAKVRTGGTVADAFPASGDLARFLAACVAQRVPFKATAGLHHPVRGDYALTYAAGSPKGTMYGFLNVAIATAFLCAGESQSMARSVLEETDSNAFRFDDVGVEWRGHRVGIDEIMQSRQLSMRSFGSCSFREPVDDLIALGLL